MTDQSELPQTFPFLCPADSMLKNDTSISTLCDSAANIAKRTRFCIVCDYPMNVKIVLFPCTHYVCYSCYCANPIQCKRFVVNVYFLMLENKKRLSFFRISHFLLLLCICKEVFFWFFFLEAVKSFIDFIFVG
jgi:hypothetical protein